MGRSLWRSPAKNTISGRSSPLKIGGTPYRTPMSLFSGVATQDLFFWIVLLAQIWHKSCVVNEYGLSSDDTGDERIGRLRDEVGRLRGRAVAARAGERPAEAPDRRLATPGSERQKREIEHLRRQLAAARRAGFRQAAPFAKDRPQGRGRRPGRRAGAQYGSEGVPPAPGTG